jgi:thymidylate kinase
MVKTIAFIGIDGAGKTTIINGVIKKLEKSGVGCEKRYMGLGRDYQSKFIKFLIGSYHKKRKKKDGKGGIGLRSNYRKRTFNWVLVQYVELWSRFIKEKFRKNDVVLFDRYFYDGLILGNKKAFSFFRRLTPKPTKCFLIYANPKIIRKRKKEAKISDIEKFYQRVEKLKKYFDIEVIDNNQKLERVINKIVREIKNV